MLSVEYVWAVGEQVTAAKVNRNIASNIAALGKAGLYHYVAAASAGAAVENLIDGWLLECNAAVVLASTYPSLDAVAAAAGWPHRDGTNLTLPNLRDGVPVGIGSLAIGAEGGEMTHVLTEAEMPSHVHPGGAVGTAGGFGGSTTTPSNIGDTGPAGGGQAHNNMQPYSVGGIWCISTGGS